MERKHIITLSGKPGSGKSSTAKELARLLDYKRRSAGGLMRKVATENDMSLEEMNAYASRHPEVDEKIDAYLKGLADEEDIVVDSRLGFHWIPDSFKVYLELDSEIAATRIFKDMQSNEDRSGESGMTINEIWDHMQQRAANEKKRYQKLYKVNPFKASNFDLIIHTERNNPLTVALWVHDRYHDWLRSSSWKQVVERVPLGYSLK